MVFFIPVFSERKCLASRLDKNQTDVKNIFTFISLFCMCMSVGAYLSVCLGAGQHVCQDVCADITGEPEGVGSVLSFCHVAPGMELRSLGLVASISTH